MIRTTLPSVTDDLHATITARTRRVYDALSGVYPVSTFFFHSDAHRLAMQLSGIEDGMRVLEVATGSGEMFRRVVGRNPNGFNVGFDLSPNMAARTQRDAGTRYPLARLQCNAVDARNMPYRDNTFDAVVCCYLFELLSAEDIIVTLQEIHRVLRPRGTFTLVLIGQNTPMFNSAYRVCGGLFLPSGAVK
ncbi:MAG: class I SAM-dependent methyltransferase [Bryobacteraceae bacterium]